MKRDETKAVRVVIQINVEDKRGRGKPKKILLDTIANDMMAIDVCVGDLKTLDESKFRIKVPHPKLLEER
jgi:hypothetical protein